jgi:uncharacterized membrane protein YkvA (DUF1232 family)
MTDPKLSPRLNFWSTLKLLWHLPTLLRLLFRLVSDRQVAWTAKALFFGALLFIVSPLDVPNFVPVLGELSDVALALLACRLFINSCPEALVAAHLAGIGRRATLLPVADPTTAVPGLPAPVGQ